jgi:Adenine-specific methyltransferase EcoRI
MDYNGFMGVPITFLDKYNPEQFEILGNLGSYAPDGYSLASKIWQ